MKRHFKYLSYVLRHKWFVFLAACKLGIPWLGIIHDLSKFSRVEWRAYARHFFNPDGSERKVRDKTGSYTADKIGGDFDLAWNNHQKSNKHHWQYWVCIRTIGDPKVLPMPDKYRREMLADGRGASKSLSLGVSVEEYYKKNLDKMQLHPETRQWLEKQIG